MGKARKVGKRCNDSWQDSRSRDRNFRLRQRKGLVKEDGCVLFDEPNYKEFNQQDLDLSPDSTDFFPLVDYHYVLHFFTDRKGEDVAFIPNSGYKWSAFLNGHIRSDGPNIRNYLWERLHILSKNPLADFGDAGAKESLKDKVSEDEQVHKHLSGVRVFPNHCLEECPGKIDEFLEAKHHAREFMRHYSYTASDRRSKLAAFFSAFTDKGWFQPEQMRLQERFNRQTKESAKIHRELEDILNHPDTNLSDEIVIARLQSLAGTMTYDLDMFKDAKVEQDLFKKARPALKQELEGLGADAVTYYTYLMAQPRVYYDLARNVVMRYVVDAISQAQDSIRKIDDDSARQVFHAKFLEDVSVEYYLREGIDALLNLNKSLTNLLFEDDETDFDSLCVASHLILDRVIGIRVGVEDALENYDVGKELPNSDFLLRKITDNAEFKKRKKFSTIFGEQSNPVEAYSFWINRLHSRSTTSKNGKATKKGKKSVNMRRFVNRDNMQTWLSLNRDGLFDFIEGMSGYERELIASAVDVGEQQARIIINFLKNYEVYSELWADSQARGKKIGVPSPKDVLKSGDYDSIENYFDTIVEGEEQYRERLSEHRRAVAEKYRVSKYDALESALSCDCENSSEVESALNVLLSYHLDFVHNHKSEMLRVRDDCVSRGGMDRYGLFLEDMATCDSTKTRKQVIADYIERIDSRIIVEPFAEEDGDSIGVDEDEDLADDVSADDDRMFIKNLVIISGRRRDYGSALKNDFRIKKLRVVEAGDLGRLSNTGSETVYLITARSCLHEAEFTLKSQDATIVKATSPSTASLVSALTEYCQNYS